MGQLWTYRPITMQYFDYYEGFTRFASPYFARQYFTSNVLRLHSLCPTLCTPNFCSADTFCNIASKFII